MPQSYTRINHHIVFGTKHRMPWIDDPIRPRLYGFIGSVLETRGNRLMAIGGTPNHINMLIDLSRERSLSETVRDTKANSSRWIHRTFPHLREFEWQAGYGAFSVGMPGRDRVKAYIRDQANHHRRVTFEEEFVRLLNEHEIEYSDGYLWT